MLDRAKALQKATLELFIANKNREERFFWRCAKAGAFSTREISLFAWISTGCLERRLGYQIHLKQIWNGWSLETKDRTLQRQYRKILQHEHNLTDEAAKAISFSIDFDREMIREAEQNRVGDEGWEQEGVNRYA